MLNIRNISCTPGINQFISYPVLLFFLTFQYVISETFCSVFVLFSSAVILVAHFLQSVSSGLVLGGELVYHRGRAEEGGILTLAGQYSSENFFIYFWISLKLCFSQRLWSCLCRPAGPNWVVTLNAGRGGAHASYYHRANKQVWPVWLNGLNSLFLCRIWMWVCVCVCVLNRSRWEWSLKPVQEHRRPQPPLGTRWNSPRPTWCFEVINLFLFLHILFLCHGQRDLKKKHQLLFLFVCFSCIQGW